MMMMIAAAATPAPAGAYEFYDSSSSIRNAGGGGGSGRPAFFVDRRSLAGLWKLTPLVTVAARPQLYPMKEFTIYPKQQKEARPPPSSTLEEEVDDPLQVPELLLMLKEDGSFRQYALDDTEEEDDSNDNDDDELVVLDQKKTKNIDQSWTMFQKKREQFANLVLGGTWDYLDGNLLLAADRVDPTSYHAKADGATPNSGSTSSSMPESSSLPTAARPASSGADTSDTLLKGRVVAKYQPQLPNNPALKSDDDEAVSFYSNSKSSNNTTTTINRAAVLDTHLSVPKGTISIGKFCYPKKHPSFFEQPMFRPIQKGFFALRQVLGPLSQNQQPQDNRHQKPMYERADFYNKTFLLTSSPIPPRPPSSSSSAGEKRWSIKYNKFVQDPPSSSSSNKKIHRDDTEDTSKQSANIRVMEVAFYQNNTFCSIAGLGESAILRGKFDVIGPDKDQIWFQIARFGFGRSVSGSVYSEGRMLSHEDAKAYWGTIHRMDETDPSSRLEIRGSVLLGWELEPLPVARFIMRETETGGTELTILDDEDEDDDDDEEEEKSIETIEKMVQEDDIDRDDDWVNPESSFQ
jgi:hypothetical protein